MSDLVERLAEKWADDPGGIGGHVPNWERENIVRFFLNAIAEELESELRSPDWRTGLPLDVVYWLRDSASGETK